MTVEDVPMTLAELEQATCEVCGVTREEIRAIRSSQRCVTARRVFYVAAVGAGFSCAESAAWLGRSAHSSVLSALRTHRERADEAERRRVAGVRAIADARRRKRAEALLAEVAP